MHLCTSAPSRHVNARRSRRVPAFVASALAAAHATDRQRAAQASPHRAQRATSYLRPRGAPSRDPRWLLSRLIESSHPTSPPDFRVRKPKHPALDRARQSLPAAPPGGLPLLRSLSLRRIQRLNDWRLPLAAIFLSAPRTASSTARYVCSSTDPGFEGDPPRLSRCLAPPVPGDP